MNDRRKSPPSREDALDAAAAGVDLSQKPAAKPPGREDILDAAAAGVDLSTASAIDTWVFDLDNTLYSASSNLFDQVSDRIGQYIASFLGVDRAEAHRLQKKYWHEHGTSLRGLMTLHACKPEEFIEFVHDIDLSAIVANPELDAALARLDGRKVIFTNGSVPHAERIMARLGVAHHFEGVFDIVASDYIPKPELSVYQRLLGHFGFDPRAAIMLDDMAHNLEPAHALGMRTVWVRTPESRERLAALGGRRDHIHHETDDVTSFLQDRPPR